MHGADEDCSRLQDTCVTCLVPLLLTGQVCQESQDGTGLQGGGPQVVKLLQAWAGGRKARRQAGGRRAGGISGSHHQMGCSRGGRGGGTTRGKLAGPSGREA